MEKRQISALEIIATAALIVIAATVVVLFFFPSFKCDPGKCEPMKSEVIAAWVQAVGSIGAIIGAIWVVNIQIKATAAQSLAMHKLELQRKRDSILSIASAAAVHSRQIKLAFGGDTFSSMAIHLVYRKTLVSDVVEALSKIPLHELGSYEAVSGLLGIKAAFIGLQDQVEIVLKAMDAPADFLAEAILGSDPAIACSHIRDACFAVEKRFEGLAKALNGD